MSRSTTSMPKTLVRGVFCAAIVVAWSASAFSHPVGAAPAHAQDARAVEAAKQLVEKRTPLADVVRTLAGDFRLGEGEIARVLVAIGIDAQEVATALREGMQAPAQRTAEALESVTRDRGEVAGALARAGYSAGETASALASRRVADGDAAAYLRRGGYRGEEAAPAILQAYRLDGPATAERMRQAGYGADAVAAGLLRALDDPGRVVSSLTLADFDPTEIRVAAVNVLRFPAEEWVADMKEGGASVLEAAEVLRADYGMDAATGGRVLLDVQYSLQNVASAVRLVWGLDAFEAYDAFVDMGVTGEIWWYLVGGGYEIPRPTIHRYRIADYRPGHSGQWIENVGVVDPDRVGPEWPDDSDGTVEVLVPYRGLDDVRATLAGRVGEIVGRTPHTFEANGTTWEGEWLEIEFRDFSSGYLRLERLGVSGSAQALALGYTLRSAELIEAPIRSMSVVLGDPVGEGRVEIPADTHEGIPFPGSSVTFDVPTLRQGGIEADVISMSSSSVDVSVLPAGEGVLRVVVDIDFEGSGPEIEGTFLEYIPCWTCASFQVPVAECSTADILCFLSALGAGASSLGTCLDLSNWEEQEVAAGPSIPFEADLTSASLTIQVTIGPDGGGNFASLGVIPEFTADVSLRSGAGDVDLDALEGWIMGQVNNRLLSSIEEDVSLGDQLVAALETARSNLGWGDIRGVYVLDDGRWFIDKSN